MDAREYPSDMRHPFALCLVGLLVGCSSESTPTPPKTCTEGGKTYALGATWRCSDGCNTCSCTAEGMSTTLIACDAGVDAGGD
jgi:hypothetical protein